MVLLDTYQQFEPKRTWPSCWSMYIVDVHCWHVPNLARCYRLVSGHLSPVPLRVSIEVTHVWDGEKVYEAP